VPEFAWPRVGLLTGRGFAEGTAASERGTLPSLRETIPYARLRWRRRARRAQGYHIT
jgi:hypothetical protein